ncbi:MAG: class I SAM-dependent methyltransferase [Treponema sp.]|nr:class I SAM-dependent methyltransferase [Treponema sp.]
MYNLLILSSSVEGDMTALNEQIVYLEKYKIFITLSIDPTEIELLRLINNNFFDCAYIHVKRRTITNSEMTYDPAKTLEQKNIPMIGNSYITQLFIADKYLTSKKSGIGLQNWIITRTAFFNNCFNWDSISLYPLIVKPNTLHASMGISEDSIVYKKEQLTERIRLLFQDFTFLHEVLIEKFVTDGQEYTVSVLGNNNSIACSVSKLQYKINNDIKINCKKQKELPLAKRSFAFAIEEDETIRQRLEYHAKTLFHHFAMKDIARFDFILDDTYYLLEANTSPVPGNSFSWEWQIKFGMKKEQTIALYLCAFHFGQIASGKPSRLPMPLIRSIPQEIIYQINHPNAVDTCPECSGPTDNCSHPYLFSMNDRISSETEVHCFLKTLTQVTKPKFILETGTYKGSSTVAFAEGLRQNGFGKIVTVEIDENLSKQAQKLFSQYPVEVINKNSLTYIPNETIDILFLDSKRDIRGQEFEHFYPYLNLKSIIVWHDSSYRKQNHSVFDTVEYLYSKGKIDRILLPTPRGLTLSMLKR